TSTAYFQNASLTSASCDSDRLARSTSPISAAKLGVTGEIVMLIGASCVLLAGCFCFGARTLHLLRRLVDLLLCLLHGLLALLHFLLLHPRDSGRGGRSFHAAARKSGG